MSPAFFFYGGGAGGHPDARQVVARLSRAAVWDSLFFAEAGAGKRLQKGCETQGPTVSDPLGLGGGGGGRKGDLLGEGPRESDPKGKALKAPLGCKIRSGPNLGPGGTPHTLRGSPARWVPLLAVWEQGLGLGNHLFIVLGFIVTLRLGGGVWDNYVSSDV